MRKVATQKPERRGEAYGTRGFMVRMSGSTSIYKLRGYYIGGNYLPVEIRQTVNLHGGEVGDEIV